MPSGYTSDLYEGKDVTFAEFVLTCARAMGASILLRDESLDVLPTEENVGYSTEYHHKRLEEAKDFLALLEGMDETQANSEALQDYADALERYEDYEIKRKAIKERYESMLEHVSAWTPPTTEHEGLKEFMIQQLTESIDFDTKHGLSYPVKQTGAEWLEANKSKAQRDIDYHTSQIQKYKELNAGRRRWVRELRESLPKERGNE